MTKGSLMLIYQLKVILCMYKLTNANMGVSITHTHTFATTSSSCTLTCLQSVEKGSGGSPSTQHYAHPEVSQYDIVDVPLKYVKRNLPIDKTTRTIHWFFIERCF